MIQSKPLIKRTASECLVINSDKKWRKTAFFQWKTNKLKNCAFLAEYRIIQKYNLKKMPTKVLTQNIKHHNISVLSKESDIDDFFSRSCHNQDVNNNNK